MPRRDLPLLAPSVWDLGHQLQREVEHGIVLGSISSCRSQGMALEDLGAEGDYSPVPLSRVGTKPAQILRI